MTLPKTFANRVLQSTPAVSISAALLLATAIMLARNPAYGQVGPP